MSEQGISYDRNGNIRSLKRYDSQAQVLDDVTLSFALTDYDEAVAYE